MASTSQVIPSRFAELEKTFTRSFERSAEQSRKDRKQKQIAEKLAIYLGGDVPGVAGGFGGEVAGPAVGPSQGQVIAELIGAGADTTTAIQAGRVAKERNERARRQSGMDALASGNAFGGSRSGALQQIMNNKSLSLNDKATLSNMASALLPKAGENLVKTPIYNLATREETDLFLTKKDLSGSLEQREAKIEQLAGPGFTSIKPQDFEDDGDFKKYQLQIKSAMKRFKVSEESGIFIADHEGAFGKNILSVYKTFDRATGVFKFVEGQIGQHKFLLATSIIPRVIQKMEKEGEGLNIGQITADAIRIANSLWDSGAIILNIDPTALTGTLEEINRKVAKVLSGKDFNVSKDDAEVYVERLIALGIAKVFTKAETPRATEMDIPEFQ